VIEVTEAAPRVGVTSVGLVEKTLEPDPVSFVRAAASCADVNEPKEVALPTEVIAPVRLALVVTVAALPDTLPTIVEENVLIPPMVSSPVLWTRLASLTEAAEAAAAEALLAALVSLVEALDALVEAADALLEALVACVEAVEALPEAAEALVEAPEALVAALPALVAACEAEAIEASAEAADWFVRRVKALISASVVALPPPPGPL